MIKTNLAELCLNGHAKIKYEENNVFTMIGCSIINCKFYLAEPTLTEIKIITNSIRNQSLSIDERLDEIESVLNGLYFPKDSLITKLKSKLGLQ